MTQKKKTLSIGIDPFLIDFSSAEFAAFPGLTAEKVKEGIDNSVKNLTALGYDANHCWIDFGKTAVEVVKARLTEREYDVVLIGAGIRNPASNFLLFEKLINIIHEFAPAAKICFNTNPGDTADAIKRWS